MLNRAAVKNRLGEIADEVNQKTADFEAGRIADKNYYRKFVNKAHEESLELQAELKMYDQAARFSGGTEVNQGVSQGPGSLVAGYEQIVPSSPMDMTAAQVSGLFQAAHARTPFQVTIQPKSFRDAVQTKAVVTEAGIGGSFGGQLPPVQSLYAVGLGYEPTRISELLPGAAMPGPSATWMTHVSNGAEAGIAAEGATKVDLSPVMAEHQVVPTKIAGTATVTLEAFMDTDKYGEGQFSQWLPVELTRSLINEESNVLLNAVSGTGNATFSGMLNTSGTLVRAMGTDSPLDCLAKAYVDLRNGPAFADADLVLMNPSTLGALRRAKDAEGRYIMDLLAGPLGLTAFGQPATAGPANDKNPYSVIPQGTPSMSGSLWGAQISATTQVPAGQAVVASVKAGAGIFWQRMGMTIFFNPWSLMTSNEFFWVAEERVAFSCPRPTSIVLVTGLPTA